MPPRKHTPSYTAEFRARGVRLFNEQRTEYRSDNAVYQAIAPKLGRAPDSLRGWYVTPQEAEVMFYATLM